MTNDNGSETAPLPFRVRDQVTLAMPDDERVWVPQAENVWFRPLLLNTVQGEWVNLLRVRRSGVLSRHRHPAPVHGYVLKGRWRYLEHDWVAEAGMYVFEPPGEVHTLVVDSDSEEMITLFHVSGALVYVDEHGRTTAFDDVHSKIELCREHYESNGLELNSWSNSSASGIETGEEASVNAATVPRRHGWQSPESLRRCYRSANVNIRRNRGSLPPLCETTCRR